METYEHLKVPAGSDAIPVHERPDGDVPMY